MDSYVKLRSLTERREQNLGDTFQRMAEHLGKTGEHALLQIRILSGDKHLYWCLELDEHGTKVRAEKVDHPDFEIVTRAETWWQIAEGSLSPLEAFTQNKMKVRGDAQLGKRILRQLAASEGIIDIC
ncbi:MAG TPA: SCP2 sterol-binding domain-containing protein [Ktedonobacteraceae bacterium]|jgi:putative sterol carrier protein|nr:SCP2 sterol-binding domain-containing protein [Ktedonobacteraceae bacterium]